jgi:hypothetical protein
MGQKVPDCVDRHSDSSIHTESPNGITLSTVPDIEMVFQVNPPSCVTTRPGPKTKPSPTLSKESEGVGKQRAVVGSGTWAEKVTPPSWVDATLKEQLTPPVSSLNRP